MAGAAPGVESRVDFTLGRTYLLLAVATSVPARVRLYGSAAGADADKARTLSTDPPTTVDIVTEYVTSAGALTGAIEPVVIGASSTSPTTSLAPAVVSNQGQASADITVTLTFIALEQ